MKFLKCLTLHNLLNSPTRARMSSVACCPTPSILNNPTHNIQTQTISYPNPPIRRIATVTTMKHPIRAMLIRPADMTAKSAKRRI